MKVYGYRKIAEVRVRHAYYAGEICRDIEFLPDSKTTQLLKGLGLKVQFVEDGIGLFQRVLSDNTEVEVIPKADWPRDSNLVFGLNPKNPYWESFTDASEIAPRGKVNVYHNHSIAPNSIGMELVAQQEDQGNEKHWGKLALNLDDLRNQLNSALSGAPVVFSIRIKAQILPAWNYFVVLRSNDFVGHKPHIEISSPNPNSDNPYIGLDFSAGPAEELLQHPISPGKVWKIPLGASGGIPWFEVATDRLKLVMVDENGLPNPNLPGRSSLPNPSVKEAEPNVFIYF